MTRFVDQKLEICRAGGTISAWVAVPADAIWFDGHFPGEPVLPGIAQLALVVEILCEVLAKSVCVTDVSRVRFKQAIMPAQRIEVQITPKQNDPLAYGFRLLKGPELACSGFLKVDDIKS